MRFPHYQGLRLCGIYCIDDAVLHHEIFMCNLINNKYDQVSPIMYTGTLINVAYQHSVHARYLIVSLSLCMDGVCISQSPAFSGI